MTMDAQLKTRWIEALRAARARIDYLGIVHPNPRHFDANASTFLPAIDAVLPQSSTPAVSR